MAADDFSLVPSEVIELTPIFNNVITESESMKKEFLNLSTTALRQYQLTFNVLTTANKDVLLAHYNARYGGYDEFTWTSVPSYIESGTNITGRWVDGSLQITPVGNKYWKCSITMEKSV